MPEHPDVEVPEGAVYLPETDGNATPLDGWWTPTDAPAWWRRADDCGDDCHHPIHGLGNPERRRHLIPAEEVLRLT